MTGGAYPDGTGGWSGADTSHDRATHERDTGELSHRLKVILEALDVAGAKGATWKELADLTGWHHGRVSSALTNLHKQGFVFTLKTRRSHCHPYVHSAWLHDWSPGAVNLRPGTTRRNHLIEPLEAVAAAAEELLNEIEVSRGAWIINDDRIETLHNALNNLTTARNPK